MFPDLLRDDERTDEARASRRRWGDGIHDRQVWYRGAETARAADGKLLSHVHSFRVHRSGHDRRFYGIQYRAVHRIHRRRNPDGARHFLLGIRARAADAEARNARLLEIRRWFGGALGVLVQSRWHEYLPHNGGAVRSAGTEYRPHVAPAAHDPGRRDADFKRRLRSHGSRFHYAGGYSCRGSIYS